MLSFQTTSIGLCRHFIAKREEADGISSKIDVVEAMLGVHSSTALSHVETSAVHSQLIHPRGKVPISLGNNENLVIGSARPQEVPKQPFLRRKLQLEV